MAWGKWIRSGFITFTLSALALSALQCSADSSGGGGGGFSANGGSGASAASGGTSGDAGTILVDGSAPDYSTDAFFANDPLPPDCSDAGAKPITPGGTPECPDDKNLKGCPCSAEGQTAACWPGKRKNRNRGLCKDGTTTCTRTGELNLVWGDCQGYQGVAPPTFEPAPGATGAAACKCFSGGYWDVKNTSPCFYTQGATVVGGVSTILDPGGA
ncbi:MAG TPA: hypothetical protein PKD61_17315, partial [Polyangiaceae bacterium]|nr:hypothetical protein [Polyangiaceae bacterium]